MDAMTEEDPTTNTEPPISIGTAERSERGHLQSYSINWQVSNERGLRETDVQHSGVVEFSFSYTCPLVDGNFSFEVQEAVMGINRLMNRLISINRLSIDQDPSID